ncbi:MAG: hypothetical protein AB7G11_02420 [Phycisphaerales bacterium]
MPELYARVHGVACLGSQRCYYCGAACGSGDDGPVSTFVKDSFTGRSEVVSPGSDRVCAGCLLCLRETASVPLIDGTVRQLAKCAMRSWSWLITAERAVAASKAHLRELRSACLDGIAADGPWAIVLSDSGQKHLLYRGVVNHGVNPPWTVTLEGERIGYHPDALRSRISLCGRLIAATGKPALREPVGVNFAIDVIERYRDGESLIEEWSRVRREPLSRLAAWLSAKKENAQHEHPADRVSAEPASIPAAAAADPGRGRAASTTGGPGGPEPRRRAKRGSRDSSDGHPTLFDLG